jgi:hypothetical protein
VRGSPPWLANATEAAMTGSIITITATVTSLVSRVRITLPPISILLGDGKETLERCKQRLLERY